MAEDIMKLIAKGLEGYIKGRASEETSKIKLQTAIMTESMKKMFDPYQRMLAEEYRGQQGTGDAGAPVGAPTGDVFAPTRRERRRVEPGAKGFTTKTVGIKEAIYERIAKKPEEQRSEKEKRFAEEYLGTAKKDISATQQRKEEIQKSEVLEILGRGTWYSEAEGKQVPFKDRQEAMDYLIDNYDIDVTDPDIQEILSKYKPGEEEITPAGGGFFGMGARKYPTKEKYGYTYEQREDGKWHKVE